MPAFRLRVRTTEIDLPVGELTVGRGTDCFLRIDDDLVSRRHARLLVGNQQVIFEDLGSRNGSRVNGQKATGSLMLNIGDTFEIGAQVFQLITGGPSQRQPTMTMMPHRACLQCQLLIDARLDTCPHCSASQGPERVDGAEPSSPTGVTQRPTPVGENDNATKAFASSFALMTGLADKLLALGRIDEAERMLAPRLREALGRAQVGDPVDASVGAEALVRAVKLAAASGKDEWYRWIFAYARVTRRRLDDKTLDELHARMLVHKPAVAAALMDYFAAQHGDDADTTQFKKRLEALLRFCRD